MTAASLAAVTLGTIGLTIYLLTKDADIDADWWSYLIQALASVFMSDCVQAMTHAVSELILGSMLAALT